MAVTRSGNGRFRVATNRTSGDYTADLPIPLTPAFRYANTIMADFNKFDPRVDSLVIETKTFWDAAIGKLADADMHWLADAVHHQPEKASNVQYERAHTGFTRTITVTVADIERLYDEKMGG